MSDEVKKYGKPKFFKPGCRLTLATGEIVDCIIEMPGSPYVVAVAEDGRQWTVQPQGKMSTDIVKVVQL